MNVVSKSVCHCSNVLFLDVSSNHVVTDNAGKEAEIASLKAALAARDRRIQRMERHLTSVSARNQILRSRVLKLEGNNARTGIGAVLIEAASDTVSHVSLLSLHDSSLLFTCQLHASLNGRHVSS